jgi:hypothetical protein
MEGSDVNLRKLWHVLSLPAVFVVAATLACTPAHAATSPAIPLADLVTQGSALDAQLAGTTLTTDNSCVQLGGANTAVAAFADQIQQVTMGFSAPLTLDVSSLTSLNSLSSLALSMSVRTTALSLNVKSISGMTDMSDYQASLAAMLRLSQDIGVMADRILEMANKILLMADNIGAMADRILVTQQLQNTNIALTQASILTAQQNMLVLSRTFNTFAYNSGLSGLVSQGNVLSGQMGAVTLSKTSMNTQLAGIAAGVTAYLNSVIVLYTQMSSDSVVASFYVNGDTLTYLGDLSSINLALAHSLDSYAAAINSLAPLTSTPVLSDATASMLQLTRDIGTMANRIVEMGDKIIIMADNVGAMSGRIVDTQTLQQSNITLTQSSLLSAQTTTVNVIATAGL